MNSETYSTEHEPIRVAFTPLKPKRRSKLDESNRQHEPVLVNAVLELKRERARITRSGRAKVQWRRVTPPGHFLEVLPTRSRPPVLARVVDKVKNPPQRSRGHQSIWDLVRGWALAFR